jgi:hypothetical protein
MSFIADRLALQPYRFPLVLRLERAGLRRSHACWRARRGSRYDALSRPWAVLVGLRLDLSREENGHRYRERPSNHAFSPKSFLADTHANRTPLRRFRTYGWAPGFPGGAFVRRHSVFT